MNGRVLGAVLVGGASSRFGSDKAEADWHGEPLAAHAAAALAPFCDAVLRVGGDGIPDRPGPGLGPLGGIAGALVHAVAAGYNSVLTIACDMPLVPAELIEALARRAPACCADAPVLGHWPALLAGGLVERLADAGAVPFGKATRAETPTPYPIRGDGAGRRHARNGALSVRRWAEDIGAVLVASPAPLANVNTPADLLAL